MSISNAWQALYLTKYGTFGFLTNPANKIKNNNKPPRGKDFSRIVTGKVKYMITFKEGYLSNKASAKGIEACNGNVYKKAEESR